MKLLYENGRSVSCVVQYVIFPPHSSAGSSNMSTWSEEDNFDGLLGVEDERERPSSKNSKIDDESEKDLSRDDL